MQFSKKYKLYILLTLVVVLGAFLRFYKLDWGQGLFSHPDEYHIVASAAQLSFPTQMNPHFFSYGTFTIYLIYFTQELTKHMSSISNFHPPAGESIFNFFLLGRFYSALFSTLTILIVYAVSRNFLEKHYSVLAALLVAITPGLIQQAHFATPESALTFFLFGSLLFTIKFLKAQKITYLVLASFFLGFALGVKISSIVFLGPLVFAIGIQSFRKPLSLIQEIFVSLVIVFTTFVLVAPFVFLDFKDFRSNFDYEGGLAIGKIPVFYTRQFIDTVPVLFQIEKILPYALGPGLLVFGILGFFLIVFKHLGWCRKHQTFDSSEVDIRRKVLFLTAIAFLSLFIANALLFAKWTRFIAPTFPFFAIFAAFLLQGFAKKTRFLFYSLEVLLLVGTILWTMAFFSIYTNRDVRITASDWLRSHAKEGSTFLVEGGNTIDIPLSGNFQRISLDFYPLEEDPLVRERIADALYTADYFLVQSRRVFMNHQRLRHLYPKTARFYDSLFSRELGFEQIKEFHSYPKLEAMGLKLEVADEEAEETWSVFDHPVIRIFKKNRQLLPEQYRQLVEGKES